MHFLSVMLMHVAGILAASQNPGAMTEVRAGNWSSWELVADSQGGPVLFVYRDEEKRENLLIYDPRSRRTTQVTQRPSANVEEWSYRTALWSPRGDVLAIEFFTDGIAQILLFYMKDNTTEVTQYLGYGSGSANWNRSGNVLYFTPSTDDPDQDRGVFLYDIDQKTLSRLLADKHVGRAVPLNEDDLLTILQIDSCPNTQQCLVFLEDASTKRELVGRWSSKDRRILPIPKERTGR